MRQLVLQLLNAPLGETLLLACRVILSVLFQITVLTRLGNGLRNPRTIYLFEPLELFAQGLLSLDSHRYPVHVTILSCKSCKRRTVISVSCSSAMHTASAAANVVV